MFILQKSEMWKWEWGLRVFEGVVNLITTFLIVMVSDAEERFGWSVIKGENQRKRSMCGLLYEIAGVSWGF